MKDIYSDEVIFEFLSRFYQQCDFSRIPIGSAIEIGKDMDLTREESMNIANFLVGKGLFNHQSMTGRLRATKSGEAFLKAHFEE